MRRSLLLLLLTLSTACSGGQDSDPTASAGPAAPPAGYASHELGPLTFSVPQEWQPVEQSNGAPAANTVQLALRAPAPEGDAAPVALALLTTAPERDAEEEVEALVAIKRDVHKAQDVEEQAVSLEGFVNATLVSYVESGATGGPQRTEVLVGDLADGAVVSLTVVAPPEAFEGEGLSAIALSAKAVGQPA